MKILLVRNTPYDSNLKGYNIQEVGIGRAFCRLGYNYDHVCFKKRNQQEWVFYESNGCKARFIEKPRIRFMRWGINTALLDDEFLSQYDLIITREHYQLMSYLYARKAKNRVAMYNGPYYNMFLLKWFSPIYDALVTKRMDKWIRCKFVKSVLAKDFLEGKGYHNVINVGVGLDTERFDNESEIKPETIELIDYMIKNRCILYVGALSERKNYPFLLNVYQKVLEAEPDVKFVMIGKSVIGAFAKVMGKKNEDYAKEYDKGLSENVQKGILHIKSIENPQLKYIYPLAKAFLLPSKLEIFGMVLLEAMYLGAPVVTSMNGGSMTLIGDNGPGIVIREFDVNKWADATLKYLRDEDYSKKIVIDAQKLVKEKYNWNIIVKEMIDNLKKNGYEI
jgi:glycosyltransferase involved in cell wall biosynthesis